MNQYDDPEFFAAYARMSRSQFGLDGAGEWQQMKPLFPELAGKTVLNLTAVMAGAANLLPIMELW